jgi:hypothetical protein
LTKAENDFYFRGGVEKPALRSKCKECYYKNKRVRDSRSGYNKRPDVRAKTNATQKLAYRRRSTRNPALALWRSARNRASKKGLPFNIEVSDIEVPSICPVLGIAIGAGYSTRDRAHAATIDRVVPALGYVKGNIQVISFRANMLKCDATVEEIEAVLAYVRRLAA